jgi:predicted secreted acid phosphatase
MENDKNKKNRRKEIERKYKINIKKGQCMEDFLRYYL